jgi:head-tail adaptor
MRLGGINVKAVTLLTKTVTYGDHNQPIETWAADSNYPGGKIFVEWWDQGGRESMSGGQIIAQNDIRCKTYYIEGLNASDYRIRNNSKDYDIESIKELGRREGQILMLKIEDNA